MDGSKEHPLMNKGSAQMKLVYPPGRPLGTSQRLWPELERISSYAPSYQKR